MEAVKWYRLGADQGNTTAQRNLGWMFEKGHGVAVENVVAYALYELAQVGDALNGSKAKASLGRLEAEMSAHELVVARHLASEMDAPGGVLTALDEYLNCGNRLV